jgi:hypothetical protein
MEHSAHAVVEDLGRHAAKRRESGGVAAQQGLQILVQHEAAPLHPAVAEHQREQPEDPLSAGLIGEHGTEMREVHLGLASRWGLKADFEAGALTRPDLTQEVLRRGVPTAVAEFADLAMQPAAGQLRKGSEAVPQAVLERCQQARPWRAGTINRRLNAARDLFADRASAQPCAPGDRRHAQALLVQLQDHDQLPKPDHLRPPPNRRGKVITCRALHRVVALEAPNQTYNASKWLIFNRPIWREFTRR